MLLTINEQKVVNIRMSSFSNTKVDFENEEFERFLRTERGLKSESTIKNYQSGLVKFEEFLLREDLEIEDVGKNEIKLLVASLKEDLTDLTVSQYLTAIKKFYIYLDEEDEEEKITTPVGLIARNEYLDLNSVEHKKPSLSQDELRHLVNSATSKRAEAMLSLMASAGLRVREACQAKVSKLDLEERCLELMTIKNDFGERKAYFDRRTRRVLNEYINGGFRDEYQHTDSDFIFLSKAYGQYGSEKYLSVDRARQDFVSAVDNSDLQPEYQEYSDGRKRSTFTTHILRRSFCQHWIDNDGDLMSLRNQVGWESLETAKNYIDDEATIEKRDKFGIDL